MTDTLTRKYQRAEFATGALLDAYNAVHGLLKGEGWKFNITADYADAEGFTTRKRLSSTDLSTITNMNGSPKSLSFECFRDEQSQTLILLQGWSDCLYLVTSAKDAAECRELNEVFVNRLCLEDVTEDYSAAARVTGTSDPSVQEDASKLTLPSLCQQMPLSGWLCLFGLVAAAFVLGLLI